MRRTVAYVTVLGLLPVCALLAKTMIDYDHQADFSRIHTYSWIKVEVQDPLWNSRVQRSVDSALVSKGWQQVPSGGDADIAAYGGSHNQQSVQTWYNGFGNMGTATTTVQNIPVGRLQVDVFDGNSKQLMWRGGATDTLTGNPEKNEKKLKKAVADLFKKFPPKSKG